MAGFSNITGDESIMFADNASFDGTERGGKMVSNGQLWIGATASPHVRLGNITSTGASVAVTNGAGTINLEAGASVPTTFVTDSGNAIPVANILNDLGGSNISTSGSGNTITTRVSGTTNHAVQLGNAGGSLTSSNLGTNGQVLIGATGADPAFATITSNDGSITFVTGANALDLSAVSNPAATFFIQEDFLGISGGVSSGLMVGELAWFHDAAQTWVAPTTIQESGHPGVIGSQNGGDCGIYLSDVSSGITPQVVLGGGITTLTWIFKIETLSAANPRYILRLGFGDTAFSADQQNGCYVEYSDNINSGNWVFKTANGGTRTTSNSSTAVTAAWHKLVITVNAAATSVSFTMDGVSLGTAIATNIPTPAITPFVGVDTTVGSPAASIIRLDLMTLKIALTTPR